MPGFLKDSILSILAIGILTLPLAFWTARDDHGEPIEVLNRYLRVLYARDFRQAYKFISSADRQLKTRNDYVRERGPFDGFAQDVARKLAGFIEVRPVAQKLDGTKSNVTVALRLPDAGGLNDLLYDWDERRLNGLAWPEQKQILSRLDTLAREQRLPMIEGEEQFVLVREGSEWKVFLDWAAGVQVRFATAVPAGVALTATPMVKDTIVRSGDLFIVGFKVKNSGASEIATRIAHIVHPKELAEYLDLVECALLLPVRLQPGEEQIYQSTYVVRDDLPDGAKTLDVNYAFEVAH
jgi:hypothetical protein